MPGACACHPHQRQCALPTAAAPSGPMRRLRAGDTDTVADAQAGPGRPDDDADPGAGEPAAARPVKKTTAKKTAAKKTTAKKATAKKAAPAKKTTANKTAAKKATAQKATAKK